MKSGKQKREEITARRALERGADGLWPERSDKARMAANREYEKRQEAEIKAAVRDLGAERVSAAALASTSSQGSWLESRGHYLPEPFACKTCGKDEIWTPKQQKWWYEVAKGDPNSGPSRCRPCRAAERRRKSEARRVHLEGVERKRRETEGTT